MNKDLTHIVTNFRSQILRSTDQKLSPALRRNPDEALRKNHYLALSQKQKTVSVAGILEYFKKDNDFMTQYYRYETDKDEKYKEVKKIW